MSSLPRFGLFTVVAVLCASMPVPSVFLYGDTVYLKNGAWIDGTVQSRGEVIFLQIGDIGKMEIPVEEVDLIEKNALTGSEVQVAVQAREVEIPGLKKHNDEEPTPNDASEDSEKLVSEGKEGTDTNGKGTGNRDLEVTSEEASGSSQPEAPPIDPELKQRIEELVKDLERQNPKFRVRAERHLKAIGPPAIPFLIPVARSDSELTRIVVMRLFHEFGDDTVVDSCIEALLDRNEYVRDYANQTLKRVTLEDYGFKPSASPRRREISHEKWSKWWAAEKKEMERSRKLATDPE